VDISTTVANATSARRLAQSQTRFIMPKGGSVKTKSQKQREAKQRQTERNKRDTEEQIRLLNKRYGSSKKERTRLQYV